MRWAELCTLAEQADVGRRVAAFASLLAALAPADAADVIIYTPHSVDPGRLGRAPGWTAAGDAHGAPDTLRSRVGRGPSTKAVNDRRFALELAREAGVALPGAA